MKRPARVLICGSNYARGYIRALAPAVDRYEIAGLLARGSDRSEELAVRHGLSLHRDPESLPRDIDIACAAMSSNASDVVIGLIERGMQLLCEHPQKPTVIERALEAAAGKGTRFHLNGHFGDLPAPSAFIRRCQGMLENPRPILLGVTATDRSLWGALDIVARALGSLDPLEVRNVRSATPFRRLEGSLGGAAADFRIQSSESGPVAIQDGSGDYLVDIRIEMVFPAGILSLLSVGGPVVWNANLGKAGPAEPVTETVLESLDRRRCEANLRAVDRLVDHAETGLTPPNQEAAFLLGIGSAWDEIGRALADRR